MKKIVRIVLVALFAIAVVAGFVYLYKKSNQKDVVYETKTAEKGNIIKKTVATGNVVPRKEIEIKPQVSGIIEELFVEAGDIVKNGDLMARVRIIPDMVVLNNAENRLSVAQLRYEDSKLAYERQKKVFEQGVIAEADYQKYRTEFYQAQEEVSAAESNLQLIKEGASKKTGNATNTLIRSTIDGMVLDVPVEVGTRVIEANTFNAGTTIANVAYMGEMIFKGKVDESEVGKIKTGMGLMLSIGAIDGAQFNAVLEYISPKGKEENGAIQFEIKAAVTLDENHFIRANYSANADIVLDRRDSVLVIPEGLVHFEENGKKAYVEVETTPQEFKRKDVKLGLSDGIKVEVLEGVGKEDKIKVPQS
ncbi:MAG: efflux RND transporter periplasmic adaptor subunit [Breznakibacter sp.]